MKTVKLSQDQLQHLIKEEISRVKRGTKRGLKEVRQGSGPMWDMEIHALLRFAKGYAQLGGAVQEQLVHLLDREFEGNRITFGAVEIIKDRLGGMNADLDEAIGDFEEDRLTGGLEPGEVDDLGYYEDGTKAPVKDLRGSEPSGVRRPKR
jgi:hypothetical protein